MTGFPINPPSTPLVDANGNATPEWLRFFARLQKKIGGPSDPFEDAIFLGNTPVVPLAPEPSADDLQPYLGQSVADRPTRSETDAAYVHQDVGAQWTAATGTISRAALASYAGQTISAIPTQAEVQATDNAIKAVSQAVVGIITDLRANHALKP